MFQICFITDKASVSADSGSASTINYASNLFLTIASVFVVAMSNVTYPSICKNFENGNMKYVTETLKYLITVLFAIFLPFILVVCFFGGDIISLVYERGEFTHELAVKTSLLFAVYTFGIFGYVCQEILNKIMYLGSKYKYTVSGYARCNLIKTRYKPLSVPRMGRCRCCLRDYTAVYSVCNIYCRSYEKGCRQIYRQTSRAKHL